MKQKMTIIMSTYNDGKYLSQALESIRSQTFTDWKLIIIDDCSQDDVKDIILKVFTRDPRVEYIRNEKRQGITKNIQTLIGLSKTEIIARLDGDDYWIDNNKLQRQYDTMNQNPNLGLVGTWAKVVDDTGKELYTIMYPGDDKSIREMILHENTFTTSSVMFRIPVGHVKEYLSSSNKYADDYNLWLKIGIHKEFMNLKEFDTAYRVNPLGISQSRYGEQIADTITCIKKYRNSYPHFYKALALWTIRRYYPVALKGKISMKVKQIMNYY